MRKIRVRVSTNKIGSDDERVVEIEDDEDPEEAATDVLFDMISWDFEEVDDEG